MPVTLSVKSLIVVGFHTYTHRHIHTHTSCKYNFQRFWKISGKLLSVTFMVMIQPGDVCGGKCVYRSESVMILYCSMHRFGTEIIWPYLVK